MREIFTYGSEGGRRWVTSEPYLLKVKLECSLDMLIRYFHTYFNEPPIVLIDEYDSPLQYAQHKGYYDDLRYFMRNFLRTALSENTQLSKAVLMGVLRCDDLLLDLGNVALYSVLDEKYASYFGFAEKEVNALFAKAKLEVDFDNIKKWYGGYQFGGETIYTPSSIINFLEKKGDLVLYRAQWISGNELVRAVVDNADSELKDNFFRTLFGLPIEVLVTFDMEDADLTKNVSVMWGIFLMGGYLKVVEQKKAEYGAVHCKVMLPNQEAHILFRKTIMPWLSHLGDDSWCDELFPDVTDGDGDILAFEKKLFKTVNDMMERALKAYQN